MKTYIHPTIKLPAGNVEVKLYDNNKSGEETLPDCIMNIGDVEEGFDYNFGEYNAPSCSIKMHNKNDVVKNMLDTNELKVSVDVDGESYFYGYVNIPTVKPLDDFNYRYEFNSVGALAALSSYSIQDFYNDWNALVDGPDGYNRFNVFVRLMAKHIGVKNFLSDDISYLCQRKFSVYYNNKWQDYLLKDVLFDKNYWNNIFFENSYDKRIENSFNLINELKNDFFFYPSIIKSGSDYKLKIMEKDMIVGNIETPTIKKSRDDSNYFMSQLIVDLLNRPVTMDATNLKYDSGFNGNSFGDVVEYFMKHTNIDRSVEATEDEKSFLTNMLIYVKENPNTLPGYALLIEQVTNYDGSYKNYNSLQEAIYNAIKQIYFSNYKWKQHTIKGLKGVKNNSAKMEYLMPAYRYRFDGNDYYIHSVNKSIIKNESEVLGIFMK